jgi:hypothetical protein
MAEQYGFTGQQVGDMTWYQLQTYMRPEKELGPGVYWPKEQGFGGGRQMRRTFGQK